MSEQWVNQLMENLKRLRELQKKYFKTRSKDILVKSKTYETVVDKIITQYFGSKESLPFVETDKTEKEYPEDW